MIWAFSFIFFVISTTLAFDLKNKEMRILFACVSILIAVISLSHLSLTSKMTKAKKPVNISGSRNIIG